MQFAGARTHNIGTRSAQFVQTAAVATATPATEVVQGFVVRDVHQEALRNLDLDLQPKVPIRDSGLTVCRRLGNGSWCSVYKVAHESSGERFALKVMPARGVPAAATAAQAEWLQGIRHPNIVQVFECFPLSVGNVRFLCLKMEYCPKGTLEGFLSERPRLAPLAVCAIMTDLTEALEYLHRLDVLHGDVQSGNVYRMKDGTVKLGGFGDPCQVPRKAGERFTVTGGCRLYAPPEWRDSVSPHRPLLSHERPLASYDMWGLGCILSELVSLEPIAARVALGDCLAADPSALRAVKESLITAQGGLFAALGLSLLQPVPEQRMEADAALRVLSRVRDHCAPLSSRPRRVFAHLYPNLEWANTGA